MRRRALGAALWLAAVYVYVTWARRPRFEDDLIRLDTGVPRGGPR